MSTERRNVEYLMNFEREQFTCFLFVLSVSARLAEVTHNGAHQKGILDFIPALVIKSFAIRYRMKTLLPFARVPLH